MKATYIKPEVEISNMLQADGILQSISIQVGGSGSDEEWEGWSDVKKRNDTFVEDGFWDEEW